jgi:hypothetical protein
MGTLLQTLLAIAIVTASAVYLFAQAGRALAGKRSKIGSCCAMGCDAASTPPTARTAFIPSELLIRRK